MLSQELYERILVTFAMILITYCAMNGLFPDHHLPEPVRSGLRPSQSQSNTDASEPLLSGHFIEPHYPKRHPKLYKTDIIYDNSRGTVPYVNEEYKVIFFHVAKAASSEWIRFFTRLQGNQAWCGPQVHVDEVNQVKKLSDYSTKRAEHMMTDPTWTKAIFVRNPKTRVLSGFLDKAISHSQVFAGKYCKAYENNGGDLKYCQEHHEEFDFFVHNITTLSSENVHWRPIYTRVDEKWWPYMTYIANMENLSEDATNFLTSIKSKVDGVSAWDRIGKSGWSDNERDCNTMGTRAFLEKKDTKHKTNAEDKLREYYTPELEKAVEKQYWEDYNNPYFKFSPMKLYPDN